MMRISRAGILTERGFTLIEILTVLFLIGVLVGLLAPHIHHQTQELPAAGLSLIGTVREAYTQAVATRQSQSLCMDLTRGEYWVEAGPCSPVGAVSFWHAGWDCGSEADGCILDTTLRAPLPW